VLSLVAAVGPRSAVAADSIPTNTVAPAISGTFQDGETLTADAGTWTGTLPITYTYQWRRCDATALDCSSIAGATDASYTLTSDDVGWRLRVRVYATNVAGTGLARSAPTPSIAAAPPLKSTPPVISGVARIGETLSATPGTWSGTVPMTYSYLWRRCDMAGTACVTIPGATAENYTLTAADVGATLRVRVTATNAAGTATAAATATPIVTPVCPRFGGLETPGVVTFPDATELSGLAASRANPGVLWTHNDSGDTERIFALNTTASYLGTYSVSANPQYDWEDIAVGPGPQSGVSYVYIGSIGGNTGRHSIYAYRAPEPNVSPTQSPTSATLSSVVKLRMEYPGVEEYNAETLMVDPLTRDIYVATKTKSSTRVYRYPAASQDPAISYTLQKVNALQLPFTATAGDISADGRFIVIKGYAYTYLWQRLPGASVAAALATAPCEVPNGWGEAIGFSASGDGYFTVAESAQPKLHWFPRLSG
jgi:hypothetical protein